MLLLNEPSHDGNTDGGQSAGPRTREIHRQIRNLNFKAVDDTESGIVYIHANNWWICFLKQKEVYSFYSNNNLDICHFCGQVTDRYQFDTILCLIGYPNPAGYGKAA